MLYDKGQLNQWVLRYGAIGQFVGEANLHYPKVVHDSMKVTPRTSAQVALLTMVGVLLGCGDDEPRALGTLEYDRITLPSPAAERIVAIDAREGQRVTAGARLVALDSTRTEAQTQALFAEVNRQKNILAELEAGARHETISQARANLAAAQAQARDANAYHARVQALARQRVIAEVELDRARAAANSTDAQVHALTAALAELLHGTRKEQIAQAQSATQAAEASLVAQKTTLDKLAIVAPRVGRVDSLPYKLGDQAPIGAPLVVMLVGDVPYARVYVPEPMRANVKIDDRVVITIDGRAQAYHGRVRMIRSEPSFTPYYALIGQDAARLSYLAEVELDKSAANLPAGLPVRADFDGAK